jgi:hypothetical protein
MDTLQTHDANTFTALGREAMGVVRLLRINTCKRPNVISVRQVGHVREDMRLETQEQTTISNPKAAIMPNRNTITSTT